MSKVWVTQVWSTEKGVRKLVFQLCFASWSNASPIIFQSLRHLGGCYSLHWNTDCIKIEINVDSVSVFLHPQEAHLKQLYLRMNVSLKTLSENLELTLSEGWGTSTNLVSCSLISLQPRYSDQPALWAYCVHIFTLWTSVSAYNQLHVFACRFYTHSPTYATGRAIRK